MFVFLESSMGKKSMEDKYVAFVKDLYSSHIKNGATFQIALLINGKSGPLWRRLIQGRTPEDIKNAALNPAEARKIMIAFYSELAIMMQEHAKANGLKPEDILWPSLMLRGNQNQTVYVCLGASPNEVFETININNSWWLSSEVLDVASFWQHLSNGHFLVVGSLHDVGHVFDILSSDDWSGAFRRYARSIKNLLQFDPKTMTANDVFTKWWNYSASQAESRLSLISSNLYLLIHLHGGGHHEGSFDIHSKFGYGDVSNKFLESNLPEKLIANFYNGTENPILIPEIDTLFMNQIITTLMAAEIVLKKGQKIIVNDKYLVLDEANRERVLKILGARIETLLFLAVKYELTPAQVVRDVTILAEQGSAGWDSYTSTSTYKYFYELLTKQLFLSRQLGGAQNSHLPIRTDSIFTRFLVKP